MSVLDKAINLVDLENLYQHILALEGEKHSLDSYDALIQGARYIKEVCTNFGLDVLEYPISVHEFKKDFYNVAAFLDISLKSEPAILITSHFDTVAGTPGADDNASAIAIMLEVARVFKTLGYKRNLIFVSFNLEEWTPYFQQNTRMIGRANGVYDSKFRFTSYRVKQAYEIFMKLLRKNIYTKQHLDDDQFEKFYTEVSPLKLTGSEQQFFAELNNFYIKQGEYDPLGTSFVLGSSAFAKMASESMNVMAVLNLETIGYTSKNPHSQTLPSGMTLEIFEGYRLNKQDMIGDFASIFADENSGFLAEIFLKNAQYKAIDLPCASLTVPLHYSTIKQNFPDLLRSDHAPFWKHGIPALLISDSANFRNPYYHTGGDTIGTLDFHFMKKVCQTTIATIIELMKEK